MGSTDAEQQEEFEIFKKFQQMKKESVNEGTGELSEFQQFLEFTKKRSAEPTPWNQVMSKQVAKKARTKDELVTQIKHFANVVKSFEEKMIDLAKSSHETANFIIDKKNEIQQLFQAIIQKLLVMGEETADETTKGNFFSFIYFFLHFVSGGKAGSR